MNKISKLGYSRFSPYRNSPFLDIKSPNGLIDMSNTDIPLLGIGLQTGTKKLLPPVSGVHSFPGNKEIREIPIAQKGLTYLEPTSRKLPTNNGRSELATSIGGEHIVTGKQFPSHDIPPAS